MKQNSTVFSTLFKHPNATMHVSVLIAAEEFIYWSSVECRGLNVEGEGKKSRARVKSRG
jgi:hypothetical protein